MDERALPLVDTSETEVAFIDTVPMGRVSKEQWKLKVRYTCVVHGDGEVSRWKREEKTKRKSLQVYANLW